MFEHCILAKNQIMKYTYLLLICATVVVWSCTKEADEPTEDCVTENITYTDGASAILNASCAFSGCHSTGSATTFAMDTYDSAALAVTFGGIVGAINHEDGFIPMPYPLGSDKIDQCDIDKLTAWVDAGAPE